MKKLITMSAAVAFTLALGTAALAANNGTAGSQAAASAACCVASEAGCNSTNGNCSAGNCADADNNGFCDNCNTTSCKCLTSRPAVRAGQRNCCK